MAKTVTPEQAKQIGLAAVQAAKMLKWDASKLALAIWTSKIDQRVPATNNLDDMADRIADYFTGMKTKTVKKAMVKIFAKPMKSQRDRILQRIKTAQRKKPNPELEEQALEILARHRRNKEDIIFKLQTYFKLPATGSAALEDVIKQMVDEFGAKEVEKALKFASKVNRKVERNRIAPTINVMETLGWYTDMTMDAFFSNMFILIALIASRMLLPALGMMLMIGILIAIVFATAKAAVGGYARGVQFIFDVIFKMKGFGKKIKAMRIKGGSRKAATASLRTSPKQINIDEMIVASAFGFSTA